jgi:tRNA-2-methylthio-N6-dimethylallyladenosine synthase
MKKKLYIETYGCQMNVSDSEVVASVMENNEYELTDNEAMADVIFVNTCSIRDNAEKRVLNRIQGFKHLKKKNPNLKVGILGCMAERIKEKFFESEDVVDLVVGPDAYRKLPDILKDVEDGRKMASVVLSEEETYDDIEPVRLDKQGVSAFISIMRGCNNFCAYCVVPYTRGRERSRDPQTIIEEAISLNKKSYKEITLLGQNVNSYLWKSGDESINFPGLLRKVAEAVPNIRIRFSTSHPKDISDELIETIANTKNICNSIHLPVQSGSTNVLKKMHRGYTAEWYLDRINKIKELIPNCGLSTDIIAGYSGETEEDHKQTLEMIKKVKYDFAFMFKYSERPDTLASKKYLDDVDEETKNRRLQEIISLQQKNSLDNNKKDIGKVFEVLIEGVSKRSDTQFTGRTDENKVMVFEKAEAKKGEIVRVKAVNCTSATLIGEIVD